MFIEEQNSMKKWWFNSILFHRQLEYRCGLSKSMDSFGPIENTSVREDPIFLDMEKNFTSWNESDNSSYRNVDYLVGVKNIRNCLSDKIILVRYNNGKRNCYSIYFSIENQILEIDNDHSSEPESVFYSYKNSSYLNNVFKRHDDHYVYDIQSSLLKAFWNNDINSSIENYLTSQICIGSHILGASEKYNDNYFYRYICGKVRNNSERDSSSIIIIPNDIKKKDLTITKSYNYLDETKKYKHLWIECENCYGLNYEKLYKSKNNVCQHCGYHLKMSSSDRIELLIDPGTWNPMDEDMISIDPIKFHSKEEAYKDRMAFYQRKTGLTEAIQTGTGKLNDIPVAIGIMDFEFMGGSMGCVVGEKITRLVEYAANQLLPLILVCASGGARMQEGSLSLMQMAKISSALYDYQTNKKLFYVSILTSPTTGGVIASFAMLGDIIIAEPNTYIAFAGKRVIEQTLNKPVSDDSQSSEYLLHKGLFDSIVPRNPLKGVLSELFQLHAFLPLTQNSKSSRA